MNLELVLAVALPAAVAVAMLLVIRKSPQMRIESRILLSAFALVILAAGCVAGWFTTISFVGIDCKSAPDICAAQQQRAAIGNVLVQIGGAILVFAALVALVAVVMRLKRAATRPA